MKGERNNCTQRNCFSVGTAYLLVEGVGLFEILLQGAGIGVIKDALGAGDGDDMREHGGGQGHGNLRMLVVEALS